MDLLSDAAELQAIQGLDSGLGLAPRGAEGGKIMTTKQEGGRRSHPFRMQGARHPPHPVAIKHRRCGAYQYAVAVVAG